MAKVAEAYGVQAVQGTLMHQMKQYVIDGNKVILLRGSDEQKVAEETFAEHDVFAVDVAFSTGGGKPKHRETRSTVYKRAVENHFTLKMKASRALMSAVTTKFSTMPFTLRALDDEKAARMGVTECLKHNVMYEYPVLQEEEGQTVAQFKFTVLVTAKGTEAVTGLELPEGIVSDKVRPEDLAAILAEPLYAPAAGKRRRRKKKAGASSEEADE
jgi:curved DNA binding protein